MLTFVPDYYRDFRCKADMCRHSCCVGWEIDVDGEAEKLYGKVGDDTDFGRKLGKSISHDGTPHFILTEDERCPFLTKSGLCEIYINLGKDALCEICTEHPRFRSFFSDRVEIGFGLCCEEAARIVLSKRCGLRLVPLCEDGCESNPDDGERAFFVLREDLFGILAESETCADKKLDSVMKCVGVHFPERKTSEWRDIFADLEILDSEWEQRLSMLSDEIPFGKLPQIEGDCCDFYSNLAEYLLFRHLADGFFSDSLREYVLFAVLGTRLVGTLCEQERRRCGELLFDTAADIARMFSSEIEYDEDNVERLIGILGEMRE